MTGETSGLAVIAVRALEGRTGSTLAMRLLGTAPAVVFDQRYPAEYRFLSYFAHMAAQMTEPFDEQRHPGVTPFFFGPQPSWGPVPFASTVADVAALEAPLLGSMWAAWTAQVSATHPAARYYAEKIAIPIGPILAAGLSLRVIDLVRDPRDVLASIRAFTARGMDGFGRRAGQPEAEYVDRFISRLGQQLLTMRETPAEVDRITLRYEDLVTDLAAVADRLGTWLGIELDAGAALGDQELYQRHRTSDSVAASIGRWRRDLEPEEAQHVADALGPQLRPLGYDI